MRQIVATGRAFGQSLGNQVLRAGGTRRMSFAWQTEANGDQELQCEADGFVEVFLDIEPAIYIDSETAEVGTVESIQPLGIVRRYRQQPPIAPEDVAAANERIARDAPFPTLRMFSVERHPLSTFDSTAHFTARPPGGSVFHLQRTAGRQRQVRDETAAVRQLMDGSLYEIPRDHGLERQWRARLAPLLPTAAAGREVWLQFMLEALPALQAEGWEISITPEFPYRVAEADDWYGDLESDRRQGWFNLRLGVVVDGQHVNLLPALARYLQTSLAAGDQTSLATDAATAAPEGPGK